MPTGLERSRWLRVLIALVLAGSVGLWWASFSDAPATSEAIATAPGEPALASGPEATKTSSRIANASHTASPRAAERERIIQAPVHPGLVVVGPSPHDPHEPGMVPHPLDLTRARINAENQLLQSLNDAMSFRKVKEMREMLVEYGKLDPRDVDSHQLGYEVIADCIEFPGDASLTAAREFYDLQRHSPLRRFVRRICFENRN
jgi:hypothetical protein